MKIKSIIHTHYRHILLNTASILILYLVSLYDFLIFHSVIEGFNIVVAFSVFMVVWNARHQTGQHFLFWLGTTLLFTAAFDGVHILAVREMNHFPGYDDNLPTQLWIAARYLQSIAFLLAPLFLTRRLNFSLTIAGFAAVTFFLLVTIFSGIFPDCYVAGTGLTQFKKISVYITLALLLGAAIHLAWRREKLDRDVLWLLVLSIAIASASELSFAISADTYRSPNLFGHYFKLLSYWLVYKAVIHVGITRPQDLLLRELHQSNQALGEKEKVPAV